MSPSRRWLNKEFPSIDLLDGDSNIWNVITHRGKWVIVFIYPRDFSPVCTLEARLFQKYLHEFMEFNVSLFGVSNDHQGRHKAFAENCNLTYPLLTDHLNKLQDVLQLPKLFGRIPARVTFLIDPAGIIRHIYSRQFSPKSHVKSTLSALRKAATSSSS